MSKTTYIVYRSRPNPDKPTMCVMVTAESSELAATEAMSKFDGNPANFSYWTQNIEDAKYEEGYTLSLRAIVGEETVIPNIRKIK